MKKNVATKQIIVSGGAGFVGSNLLPKLIEKNYQVTVIDNLSSGLRKNIPNGVTFFKKDIRETELLSLLKGKSFDAAIHLAAQIDVRTSIADPAKDAHINIIGTLNFLNLCKKLGVGRIIFASSGGAIYGESGNEPSREDTLPNPMNPYGISKLTSERHLLFYRQRYGIPFFSLRFSNIYGPGQGIKGEAGVVAVFCRKLLSGGRPVVFGDGLQTRDFVFVDDAVESFVAALSANPEKSGVYNISTGAETNIKQSFEILKKISKSKKAAIYAAARNGEQIRSCLDYSKAKKHLFWQPKHDIEKGLKITFDWFKKRKT